MKVSAKQYAKILWEILEKKDVSQGEKIIKNFVKILFKRKQLNLAEKIMKALKEQENERQKVVEAKIKTAFEISDKERGEIENLVRKNFHCEKIEADFSVDENLIGGIVVEASGCVWDLSVRGGIRKLQKSIS